MLVPGLVSSGSGGGGGRGCPGAPVWKTGGTTPLRTQLLQDWKLKKKFGI